MSKRKITENTKGTDSLMYSSVGQSSREHTVYRTTPTGGVILPIVIIVIIKIPKCTGSTPAAFTIGKKIGVNRSVFTVGSMNIPAMNKNPKIINKRRVGSFVIWDKNMAMVWGARFTMITYPKIEEQIMINIMIPLSIAV